MTNEQERPARSADPASLAPVLGLRRDGTGHADSARGLLTTVLGELVLPLGGEAWTGTLVEALDLVGVRDKAARQAVARLHERGWLERRQVGRRARWRLTPSARDLLERGGSRIYGHGAGASEWDGRWRLLLLSVPESHRHLRYRLSVGLSWAGFAPLGQGLWLSARPSAEGEAATVVERLGLGAATTFVAEVGQLGDDAELAARAWDLAEVARLHVRFLADEAAPPPDEPGPAAARLAGLVHRWRRFPSFDPGLPPALLPADWPGGEAAARFDQLRRALSGPSRRWWADAEHRHGGGRPGQGRRAPPTLDR